MKKILGFVFFCIGIALLALFIWANRTANTKQQVLSVSPTQKISHSVSISSNVLFVPYWTLDSIAGDYDEYIYFGISPNEKGIDIADEGYKGIPSFVLQTQGKKTLLTLRMLDTAFSEKVLQNEDLQEKIIQSSIKIASDNGFDGVVLDLEYSGLAFPSVTKSLTDFSIKFAQEVHTGHLSFYQALYGDTYYLGRPYVVKDIAKATDGIFVMSYDFHKANGTPGPNFPVAKRADSDYTFQQMITDFSKDVPKEKLTVIFGMFGYDWTIDDKGRAIGQAKSLSDNDIQAQFLAKCSLKECKMSRDSKTQEPNVSYIDNKGQEHIVWWEDMQSLEKKKSIIEQNGISKIGFWANGYFDNNQINQ